MHGWGCSVVGASLWRALRPVICREAGGRVRTKHVSERHGFAVAGGRRKETRNRRGRSCTRWGAVGSRHHIGVCSARGRRPRRRAAHQDGVAIEAAERRKIYISGVGGLPQQGKIGGAGRGSRRTMVGTDSGLLKPWPTSGRDRRPL